MEGNGVSTDDKAGKTECGGSSSKAKSVNRSLLGFQSLGNATTRLTPDVNALRHIEKTHWSNSYTIGATLPNYSQCWSNCYQLVLDENVKTGVGSLSN